MPRYDDKWSVGRVNFRSFWRFHNSDPLIQPVHGLHVYPGSPVSWYLWKQGSFVRNWLTSDSNPVREQQRAYYFCSKHGRLSLWHFHGGVNSQTLKLFKYSCIYYHLWCDDTCFSQAHNSGPKLHYHWWSILVQSWYIQCVALEFKHGWHRVKWFASVCPGWRVPRSFAVWAHSLLFTTSINSKLAKLLPR